MNYVRSYPETHRAVKVYAAQHGLSMQEVVSRAVALLMNPSSEATEGAQSKHPTEQFDSRSRSSLSKNHRWHEMLDYILESGVTRAIQAVTYSLSAMKELAEAKLNADSRQKRPIAALARKD